MKKIFLGILFLLFPTIVSASSINYEITDFLVDAEITVEGNLNVQELIVLDGTFNGYIRDLAYKNPKLQDYETGNINFANSAIYNASGISNVKVSTKKVSDEITFGTFNEVFIPLTRALSEKSGINGNYYFKENKDLLSYKMFSSADDEIVAFLISYTVDKAIVIHNDIAELYWTFIGNDFADTINNLKIRVTLPQADHSALRYWAHGDITGNINQTDDKTILATMKSLSKNNAIDIRMLFDKSMITNSEKLRNSKQDAIAPILEIEGKRAEDANNQRAFIKTIYNAAKWGANILFIILISLWIYIYFRFDKEHKSKFNAKYYREFTGTYNVEVIDYLMKKSITSNAMSASIMNLIYKKNISVEEISSTEKNKKYKFILQNNNEVSDTEQMLLDFLFEEVGKENSFTTTDLEKYAKSTRTCEKFTKSYSNWKSCVVKDAEQEKFYETNGIPVVIGILSMLVSILYFMVVMYYQVDYFLSYLVLPASIVFLFYTIFLKKRTIKGNEDYLKWNAFKNFLNDFGNFKVKELPEIVLWEKYLVYATIFGLADKVEKSMNVKISEFQDFHTEGSIYYNWNPIIDFHIYHLINNSVNTAISSSIQATAARANSNSSSNGFGGGFSSGGGFGGGGGGGRGF